MTYLDNHIVWAFNIETTTATKMLQAMLRKRGTVPEARPNVIHRLPLARALILRKLELSENCCAG